MAYGEKVKWPATGRVPGDSFLPEKIPVARQQYCFLSESSPTQSQRAVIPYWRPHKHGSQRLLHPGHYLRLCPIQLTVVLFYNRPCYLDRESKKLYIIHGNKHREAAKMKRQRNMAQMKEQI